MKDSIDRSVAALFKSLSPALALYARQWTSASQADDIVQEVFVKMLASRKLPDEPRTWLFRCVRNAAISSTRSSRRREKRHDVVASDMPAWFAPADDDRLDAKTAQAAMAALPLHQREILTLRVWSQMTLSQIRDVTGMPVSTIHDEYRAALGALRTRLES